jgi:hypothetical protein
MANPRFSQRKDFTRFLKEIDRTPEFRIKEIMGEDNYIDTPGFYKLEAKEYSYDIHGFMWSNMGSRDLKALELYWITSVKEKGVSHKPIYQDL